MKRTALLSLLAAACVWAQTQAPPQQQTAKPEFRSGSVERSHVPTYSDVYCAGFIADRQIQNGLYVLSAEEGGIKNNYSERDIVYLNRGAGYVVNPGGEYMLIRPVRDPIKVEVFQGQFAMLKSRGQMYAEVGRLKVDIVHENTVTARVLTACKDIVAGDVAIPFDQKPLPQLKPAGAPFDRFAPPSGKTHGLILTGKEYKSWLGAGDTVYLNIGGSDGVAVGQWYRVFRTFASAAASPNRRYMERVPTHLAGMREGYRLTQEQKDALPRDILGELVILWVEPHSAVGLITRSRMDILAGDEVELP